MTSHPDMQKIQIIGFFFENTSMLHWKFEMGGKKSTNGSVRLHIYLHANKTLLWYIRQLGEKFKP
jgi:hypothetical protein